jgi:uncharacterized protein (TIGR02996 family)
MMTYRATIVWMLAAVFGADAEAAVRVHRPADPNTVVLLLDNASPQQVLGDTLVAQDATTMLRNAQLLQQRHEFQAATRLLDEILLRAPRDRAARLMRAQIRLHLQEPKLALQDCTALAPLVDVLTTVTCTAQARAALGDVRRSYEMIATALKLQRGEPATRSWSAGVAAELAARTGDTNAAGRWHEEAFRLDPNSHYARLTYADWLLAQGRRDEALRVRDDGSALTGRTQ